MKSTFLAIKLVVKWYISHWGKEEIGIGWILTRKKDVSDEDKTALEYS